MIPSVKRRAFGLVGLLLVGSLWAATLTDEKLALEQSFKNQIEDFLRKVVGMDKFQVKVNVELTTEVQAAVQQPTSVKKMFAGVKSVKRGEFLPGIPTDEVVRERQTIEDAPLITSARIKRMDVRLWLDEDVTEEQITQIKTSITELVGVNLDRGDSLRIEKMAFAKREAKQEAWWRQLVRPPAVYGLVAGFLAIILLIGLSRYFVGALVSIGQKLAASRESGAESAQAAAAFQSGPVLGPDGAGAKGAEGKDRRLRRPFGFVTAENMQKLLFLVQNESPDTIAVTVGYLDAEVASRVIAGLTPEIQAQVMTRLAVTRQMPAEMVQQVEQAMKAKLDYLLGGMDSVINILDRVDPNAQKNILAALSRDNPALGAKVRERVFTFEDLAWVDADAIQAILREARMDTFATALKNSPEAFRQQILSKLTAGAQQILKQAVDLAGTVSQARAFEEQRRIVEAARRLERAGFVSLKRVETAASPSGTAAARPAVPRPAAAAAPVGARPQPATAAARPAAPPAVPQPVPPKPATPGMGPLGSAAAAAAPAKLSPKPGAPSPKV